MQFIKDKNKVIFASVQGEVGLEKGQSIYQTDDAGQIDIIMANLGNVTEKKGKIAIVDPDKENKPSVMVSDKSAIRKKLGL